MPDAMDTNGSATDILDGPSITTPEHLQRLPDSLSADGTDKDFELFQRSIRRNRIVCIGAGYVGGPTMAMIALKCPDIQVHVVDICQDRIAKWNSDKPPIYEPDLNEIVQKCRGRNLFFSTDVEACTRDCDVIFVSVNTPTKQFGIGKGMAADLSAWELASRSIAEHAESPKIIIEKSTVPVRTAESLTKVLNANSKNKKVRFAILSNPEFLAEGTAISDLQNPDRVLIGGQDQSAIGQFAISVLVDIYRHWVPVEKIITINLWSSELSKLVANAFLAQRVSSINAVAMLCEKTGADVRQVAKAIGSDTRIGSKFLNASVGFGGGCLQKDVLSLAYLCDFYGLKEIAQYWNMVKEMNDLQKCRFSQRIIHSLFNTVNRKKIAIFGFAFKKNTADTRCTPAFDVCSALMDDGARVHVYDPQVDEQSARREFVNHGWPKNHSFDLNRQFFFESTPQAAVEDAHAIVILTEWDEFQNYEYSKFFQSMIKPAFIFDGRNILDHKKLAKIGFEVEGVGVSKHVSSMN